MAEPMLAVENYEVSRKPNAVSNLLPCRIHHTGSVDPVSEYWSPVQAEDSTSVAYFRGRKLQGRTVALPDHYQGVVVERKPPEKEKGQSDFPEHNQETKPDVLQVTARFDKVVVWSHGLSTDPEADPYIRGMDEWLQVADKIHSFTDPAKAGV